ncbi:hypothetical protein M8818_001708 [Zalaria obscura]|uniref:Uncharacterized protein n=1 Tax=Zalaria obscura TaxID=2024903 RepID=A0ACC3SJ57_9PEZI
MAASSPKAVGLCLFLFLASALLTLTFRSPHSSRHWPNYRSKNKHSDLQQASQVAFATFLGGNTNTDVRTIKMEEDEDTNDEDDGYFLATRVLAYQLLHSPVTGTNSSIPLLVFVTPNVSARKVARLRSDGATVIEVEQVGTGQREDSATTRGRDNLSKLQMWAHTQYKKICYISPNVLITKRLDGIFWDEGTISQSTLANQGEIKQEEAALPRTYSFSAHAEFWGYDHPYPPRVEGTTFNSHFFVFVPDKAVQRYYSGLLGRFDGEEADKDLLNYAHRREGNMPWKPLWYGWNIEWPTERDWRSGAASFTAKFWDGDSGHDPTLKAMWRETRAEMMGYHMGRDAAKED